MKFLGRVSSTHKDLVKESCSGNHKKTREARGSMREEVGRQAGLQKEPGFSSQCHVKLLKSFNQRRGMTQLPYEKEASLCI